MRKTTSCINLSYGAYDTGHIHTIFDFSRQKMRGKFKINAALIKPHEELRCGWGIWDCGCPLVREEGRGWRTGGEHESVYLEQGSQHFATFGDTFENG